MSERETLEEIGRLEILNGWEEFLNAGGGVTRGKHQFLALLYELPADLKVNQGSPSKHARATSLLVNVLQTEALMATQQGLWLWSGLHCESTKQPRRKNASLPQLLTKPLITTTTTTTTTTVTVIAATNHRHE